MNKNEYNKYYKKGGTYVIPIEIFDELFNELERLNKARKTDIKYNKYLQKKIIRLNNIIKELEKWLNDRSEFSNFSVIIDKLQELKGEKND